MDANIEKIINELNEEESYTELLLKIYNLVDSDKFKSVLEASQFSQLYELIKNYELK